MKPPLRWYGGKSRLASRITARLPPHRTYVEVFGGSAAVLLAKPPSPVEVLNDINGALTNFYRVLQDPTLFNAFARRIALTPHSRGEFRRCRETWETPTDPVERAVRWYVATTQSFSGNGGWSYCITETKNGMSAAVHRWLRYVDRLPAVHARLRTVQIEEDDWATVLDRYDTPATCFYCDPPYPHDVRQSTKGYASEMTQSDHERLISALLSLRGTAIVSGYDHPLYRALEAHGWQRHILPTVAWAAKRSGGGARAQDSRTEVLRIHPRAITPSTPEQLAWFQSS